MAYDKRKSCWWVTNKTWKQFDRRQHGTCPAPCLKQLYTGLMKIIIYIFWSNLYFYTGLFLRDRLKLQVIFVIYLLNFIMIGGYMSTFRIQIMYWDIANLTIWLRFGENCKQK